MNKLSIRFSPVVSLCFFVVNFRSEGHLNALLNDLFQER